MGDPFAIPSRKQMRRTPFRPRCKNCRTNKRVIPIRYSHEITESLLEKERNGELKIGGSSRSVDAPNWFCTRCETGFQR
ncbi:hypothetical protein [Hydrogenimonas cancrithermarum]|uniref:Uncharacterized protein n=1 Tax=Hydrogenimonas cancrithermarum TaxID=2993563 RepID=A0ABN6WSL8_9BACT|nr:hypothetical protein [Hydrogenimonas cancrithermarum]BDY12159.1 hypothetical protein HCR_04710 [Hydrogenimonas cancrithermarum]